MKVRSGSEHTNLSRNNLPAVIEAAWHLCKAGQPAEAYQLLLATDCFKELHRQGNNGTLLVIYQELLAYKLWNPDLDARIHNELGEMYNDLGQKTKALLEYREALTLFQQIGAQNDCVEVLGSLGAVYRALAEPMVALKCYQEALELCENAPGGIVWHGRILNNLGKLLYTEGINLQKQHQKREAQKNYVQALAYYKQALIWHQVYQLSLEEATTITNIGDVYQVLQRYRQAKTYYWRALAHFREHGDRRHEAIVLNSLGLLYQKIGQQKEHNDFFEETRICCEYALRIFREVGDRWQESKVLRNLGRFYLTYQKYEVSQRYQFSLACFVYAQKIADELYQQQEEVLPLWIEKTLRMEMGDQQFENLLNSVTKFADKLIETLLSEVTDLADR
jgi:tetratricopeptide (TPR) repeat protein